MHQTRAPPARINNDLPRMSSKKYSPPPPPPREKTPKLDMDWRYNEDMRLILHNLADCDVCRKWAKHYATHLFSRDPSLLQARKDRDRAHSEGRQELAALRQELAALRQELEEVRQEVKDAVARQGDEDMPRRRKVARHAHTHTPLHTTAPSSPRAVAHSPGPAATPPQRDPRGLYVTLGSPSDGIWVAHSPAPTPDQPSSSTA